MKSTSPDILDFSGQHVRNESHFRKNIGTNLDKRDIVWMDNPLKGSTAAKCRPFKSRDRAWKLDFCQKCASSEKIDTENCDGCRGQGTSWQRTTLTKASFANRFASMNCDLFERYTIQKNFGSERSEL
jgi:uncharacterized protein YjbI with pentapeptide repeats